MGWKGTMRSIAAASRAADREAARHHKAAVKAQKIEDAEDAVDEWEDYISKLISVHVDIADAINWEEIANTPKPKSPKLETSYHDSAKKAVDNFKPKFFDFLSGGSDKKQATLEEKFANSNEKDKAHFNSEKKNHKTAMKEWEQETSLARRLIAGENDAVKEVLEEMQSLTEQDLIGSQVSFTISDNGFHAIPEVHGDDIIPDYRRKQLASGSLSQTKMPVGEFNELYQDYVASVALKVAGDMFHILPLSEVYVTCVTPMLNTQTGHQELSAILSVQFVKETFKALNLSSIDPSDSMRNFNHVMKFKRTKGFEKIEPLKPFE